MFTFPPLFYCGLQSEEAKLWARNMFFKRFANQFQLPLHENNKNVKRIKVNILKSKSEDAEKIWCKQVVSRREYKSNYNFDKCITVYLKTLKRGNQSKQSLSNWE